VGGEIENKLLNEQEWKIVSLDFAAPVLEQDLPKNERGHHQYPYKKVP